MRTISMILLMITTAAVAMAEEKQGERFAERKAKVIQDIEGHINVLQTAKSCFSAASDHMGLKNCHLEKEQALKKMREANIDSKIHELEARKARLSK